MWGLVHFSLFQKDYISAVSETCYFLLLPSKYVIAFSTMLEIAVGTKAGLDLDKVFQIPYLWDFSTIEDILCHFTHIESHPNWVILIAYLPQANIGIVTMLHHQTLVWHFRRKLLPRVLYLAPGRFDVAVSKGMPRKATSRSPVAFGGETIGRRINDAIPPALCKSFGLKGS